MTNLRDENHIPRVLRQIELAWSEVSGQWHDEISKEYERTNYKSLITSLNEISNSYNNLMDQHQDYLKLANVDDLEEKSKIIRENFKELIELLLE